MELLEGRTLLSVQSISMESPAFQEGTAWPGASSDDGPEPGLGEIATFTTDDDGYPQQYNVTINWGDGTAPSSGTIIDDPDSPNQSGLYVYDIYSAHTYSNAGNYTIMVSIQDSVDDTSASTTPNEGQVTVSPQALSPANPQPSVNAIVGTPLNNADVATFTSANPDAVPADFAATISWGDGSSAGTLIEDSSGIFHVEGSHTYTSDPAGGYQISVDVVHTGTDSSLLIDNTPTISPAMLELTPATVTVSDASIESGASYIPAGTVIGTFTDTAGYAPSSNYTSAASYVQFPGAAENGGGTTNTPIAIDPLVANGSTYTVETAETTTFTSPLLPGAQTFSILIENTADGAIVQGTSSLVVTDAPLGQPGNGQPSLAGTTRGTSYEQTLAAFTDSDILAVPADFAAKINWGDGTASSTGTVTEVTSPNPSVVMFDVAGTHTYTSTGSFSVDVAVQGLVSTIELSNPDPVEVIGAPLTVPAPAISISDDSINGSGHSYIPAGTVVGTFTDTGGADPATDYTGAGSYATFTGAGGNTPILVAPIVTGSSTFTVTTAADTVFSSALTPGTESDALQITNSDGDISQSASGTLTVTDAPLGVPASGQPLIPDQVRGSGFTATLVAFTDPDTLATPGDFTASINWGDGDTGAGTITVSDGSFHVQGTHTYATASPPGGFAITVSIAGVSPYTSTLSPSNLVTVTGSALELSAAPVELSDASINGSDQAYIPAGTVVGTFTDTGGPDTASNYTGAGSSVSFPGAGGSTALSVSLNGSTFTIATAAATVISPRLVPGSESFQLQVTNTDGDMSASASGTLTVTDAPLSPPGDGQTAITATRGTSFTTTAAAFTDPDTLAAASDFSATIYWGDTISTVGTLVKTAPGSFEVQGSHTYTTAGPFSITVDVQGQVSTIVLDNSATVSGAPLQVSASPVTVSDASINGSDQPYIPTGTVVGTFTDTGGADPTADYTGEGSYVSFPGATGPTFVAVTPVVSGSSTFTVTTAAATIMSALTPGTASFSLQITNSDGESSTSAGSTLTVTDAPLQDPSGPPTLAGQVRGSSFTATVADFTDADTLIPAGDFTASINWGDGNTSAGTITGSAGSFSIQGTHTYATVSPAGGFPIGVSIHSPYTASLSLSTSVIVTGSALDLSAAPVSLSDASINGLEQAIIPAGTVVGTFTDTGGPDTASNYTGTGSYASFPGATANTPISVSLSGSTFTVTTAAATVILPRLVPGSSSFTLQLTNTDGSVTASASGTVTVTDAPLSPPEDGQTAIPAMRGTGFTTTAAAFTDPDTLAAASDFTATIFWGDTTSTAGTIVRTAPGSFAVQGSHTYTTAGSFSITVDVQGLVSTIVLDNSATVSGAPLQVSASPVTISDGSINGSDQPYIPAGTMVGSFTDTGGADLPGDYTGEGSYVSFAGATGPTLVAVAPVSVGSSTFTITTAAATIMSALTPGTGSFALLITNSDGETSGTSGSTLTVTDAPMVDPAGPPTISNQVRGSSFTVTFADFTDADTLIPAGDFTASINWGDGDTTTGEIDGAAGSFQVQGTHAYSTVSPIGGFPISVSIHSPYTASLSLSSSVIVTGSALDLSAAPVSLSDASINGLEQAIIPAGTVVGSFTDTGGPDTASKYTGFGSYTSFPGATANTPILVSLNGSTFTVTTAASTVILPRLVPGSGAFTLQVTNTDGDVTASASGTVTVTDAPLSPPGDGQTAIAATRGTSFTATAAAFTDPDTLAAASDFSATIHWGDNTATAGTVVESAPGSFLVQGSHTYTTAGSFSITVDVQGLVSTIVLDNSATVSGAPLQVSASPVTISDGSINGSDEPYLPAGTVVGSFTDTGGADPDADYTGEGSYVSFTGATGLTPVTVTPVFSGSSTFTVATAAATVMSSLTPGTTSFALQITNSDGDTSGTAGSTLTVTDAPLEDPAAPTIANQVRGIAFTATVADFTDADTLIPAGDFTASIKWGDGDTSAGTIIGTSGSFQVQGTHTYATVSPPGGYPISISIQSPYTSSLSLSNSLVVTGSTLQLSTTPVSLSDASANGLQQSIVPAGTVVGSFTDTGGAGPDADYTGAGSYVSFPGGTGHTPISVSLSGSTFTVTTAADTVISPRLVPGSGTFTLQVTNTDGNVTASASGTMTIADAPLGTPSNGQPTIADATLGTGLTAAVGAFTDGDPLAMASDFTATINWGDGTAPTPGIITESSGGVFLVSGNHTYSSMPGGGSRQASITVAVSDHWGGTIALADAVTVNAPAIALAGQLNPVSDTGISSYDAITSDTQPNFFGTTGAFASVSLYAQSAGMSAVLIGHTTAAASGAWSITSANLAQGSYTIFATAVDQYGQSQATTQLLPDTQQGPLVIDTTGPAVEGVSLDRSTGQLTITFQGDPAGLDQASLLNLGNYRVSKRNALSGANLVTSVSTSDPAQPDQPETVTLQLKNGRLIPKGVYYLTIAAGGIEDVAGNSLNGLFTGSFPTGYGQSDSNFVAEISVKSRSALIAQSATPDAASHAASGRAHPVTATARRIVPRAVTDAARSRHAANQGAEDSRLAAFDLAIDEVGGSSKHHRRG
jgi:hypothetical protein